MLMVGCGKKEDVEVKPTEPIVMPATPSVEEKPSDINIKFRNLEIKVDESGAEIKK